MIVSNEQINANRIYVNVNCENGHNSIQSTVHLTISRCVWMDGHSISLCLVDALNTRIRIRFYVSVFLSPSHIHEAHLHKIAPGPAVFCTHIRLNSVGWASAFEHACRDHNIYAFIHQNMQWPPQWQINRWTKQTLSTVLNISADLICAISFDLFNLAFLFHQTLRDFCSRYNSMDANLTRFQNDLNFLGCNLKCCFLNCIAYHTIPYHTVCVFFLCHVE